MDPLIILFGFVAPSVVIGIPVAVAAAAWLVRSLRSRGPVPSLEQA